MSNYTYDCCVYIGRFQPFHNGHLKIVLNALNIAENLIIVIGSHKKPRSIKNPWTTQERIQYIEGSLMEALNITHTHQDKLNEIERRVKFIAVRDYVHDHEWIADVWSKATTLHDKDLFAATQDERTCLVGCVKDKSSRYINIFSKWNKVVYPNIDGINATDIRKDLFTNSKFYNTNVKLSKKSIDSLPSYVTRRLTIDKNLTKEHQFFIDYAEDHRYTDLTIKYKANGVCADAMVIKSGHVLLVKRKFIPGKNLWALPGGHVNNDETFEQAAIRELIEETNIQLCDGVLRHFISNSKVFDNPNRSFGSRKITNTFLIDLGVGDLPVISASDDASKVRWVSLLDLYEYEDKIHDDHFNIINQMIKDKVK